MSERKRRYWTNFRKMRGHIQEHLPPQDSKGTRVNWFAKYNFFLISLFYLNRKIRVSKHVANIALAADFICRISFARFMRLKDNNFACISMLRVDQVVQFVFYAIISPIILFYHRSSCGPTYIVATLTYLILLPSLLLTGPTNITVWW